MRLMLAGLAVAAVSRCAVKPHSILPHVAMSASIGCEAADGMTTMYCIGALTIRSLVLR